MFAGFVEANATCMSRYKESGTTATLAVSVGWELLVASVGDSLAYLDTGFEIVQVGLAAGEERGGEGAQPSGARSCDSADQRGFPFTECVPFICPLCPLQITPPPDVPPRPSSHPPADHPPS